MTRIVAGSARGRRLKVPADGTRPTSDRVREAVFSSLESAGAVRGARVLDLYAGTGALGLEAASRGAIEVTLVDNAAHATRVIADNARTVGGTAVVVKKAVAQYLNGPPREFDLIFLDPPYDLPRAEVENALVLLSAGWLAERAVVVVERGRRDPDLVWPPGFADQWGRRFGDTHVLRAVWYGPCLDPQP
jgi:16S rRNA (guanine966-N2)-methyltransferase